MALDVQGVAKKVEPQSFSLFSQQLFVEIQREILQLYSLKPSASNGQIKCGSVENDEVEDFLTWPPTDFSALKNVQDITQVQ